MSTEKIKQLELQANELRKAALTMIYEAQSGHPGGAFSAADILFVLVCIFVLLLVTYVPAVSLFLPNLMG